MGPIVRVLLQNQLTPVDRSKIEADLRAISSEFALEDDGCYDMWGDAVDLRPIGINFTCDAQSISVAVKQPEDYELEELRKVEDAFGFLPQQLLCIDSGYNSSAGHFILGNLALHFASIFDGLIEFCGAILPNIAYEDLHVGFSNNPPSWSDAEPYFLEMIRDMPGKILSVQYEAVPGGRVWASHVADVEFMKAWVKHPQFHMIK